MKTKETPDVLVYPATEIDQFLNSVPSTESICQRLDQLDKERKSLKRLLKLAHVKSVVQEVQPC